MTRVLALVGAILLIVLAVLVRAAIDDDGSDDDGGDDGDELVVHCIPELAEACQAIDRPMALTIADPQETIDAVAAGEDIDAWVTLDPWPEIATFSDDDDVFVGAVGVASDPLALVVRPSSLPDACAEAPTFACVHADDPDRAVLLPPDTALGLLTAGAAAADVFLADTGSASFARQDLESRGPAAAAIDEFVFAADPVEDMLLFGPAGPSATIDTEDGAELQIGGTREAPNLEVLPLTSTVAVVVSGPQADRITGEPSFTDALVELGWRLAPDATTTGLPSAGVLLALEDFLG